MASSSRVDIAALEKFCCLLQNGGSMTVSNNSRTLAFLAPSQNCEKRLLASLYLSVHMEQLGSHWTDIQEIGYLNFFKKSVEKFQVR